jgi:oligopeptide transport system permease protein
LLRYVLGRLGQLVLVFFGVTFLIHIAVWALPGDPVAALAGTNKAISPSTIAAIRKEHNLDDPLIIQYLKSVGQLLSGNFGQDLSGRSIGAELSQRWPITAKLALTALFFEAAIGIFLGIIAAVRNRKAADYVILWISTGALSIPLFVLGYASQYLFGVKLSWVPVAGIGDGWPGSYLLPAIVLGSLNTAVILRVVRTDVLDGLRSDYARTAHAKGLSYPRVLLRHVLRNSLIPVVTLLALDLGYMLGGAVIVEGIFNLPGIGQLLFQSINLQDGATVVAVSTLLVMIFLLINLIVDLMYGVLDPRIRR